ncbi:MAG: hypothetical protein MZW92_44855 [Comamonadaceae bacterium]|nr:hypothetical protein [Comamonadaceae bacterium]
MVLNAVVLTWFAFFALGLSAYMGDAIVQAIHDRRRLPRADRSTCVGESHCATASLMILMAIICFQAPEPRLGAHRRRRQSSRASR